jgi:RimJ/RimL family protein N-acetyltransferase
MNLPKKLETRRLILRPFIQDDFEIFSNIMKYEDVVNNLKFVLKVKSEKNAESLFKSIIVSYNSTTPILALLISNKESGVFIGTCGLFSLEGGNKAEIFYTVFPKYRKYGFAIEAVKRLLKYAFIVLNLSKIIAYINPKESRVWKVAERVGLKYMGQIQIKEISSNAMYFSIEKGEFEAQEEY